MTGTTCMQCGIELHEVGAEFCNALCAEMHETNGSRTERETVARIVAMLRAEAKRLGEDTDAERYVYGPPYLNRAADMVERGDWRKP